jgi:hypothetical protein
MMARDAPQSVPSSLEQRIRHTESRLAARRAHLGTAVGGMGEAIRRQTVSPESLATAFLCGVALERSRNFWDWRLLTILGAGRAGIRLLHGLASGAASSATGVDRNVPRNELSNEVSGASRAGLSSTTTT